ncbi:hypothetical protein [Amycolatopsis sp. lyj-346]|uniref:hypothetical protein n=1 Tax=Amycolatopsis sp. lyj-346 TaxID=2789289 RepID=UPI0039785BBC
MADDEPEDVLSAVLVPDFAHLALRVNDGDIAVFGWEWTEEGPETFEALFEEAAKDAMFERIAHKRVTIAWKAGVLPDPERKRQAIASLEAYRDHR